MRVIYRVISKQCIYHPGISFDTSTNTLGYYSTKRRAEKRENEVLPLAKPLNIGIEIEEIQIDEDL